MEKNNSKKEYTSMEELLQEEVMYESYVRALTDDFSVVDAVRKEYGEEEG